MPSVYRAFAIGSVAFLPLLSGCDKITRRPAISAPEASRSPWVTELNESTFEAFRDQKGKLVIIDFYADWCGFCHELSPILEKLAAERPGLVVIGKVNVDHAPKLVRRLGVSELPDVRLFRDGRAVFQFKGVLSETELRGEIAGFTKDLPVLSH